MDRMPCRCNHAITGRCFIKVDNDWRNRNLDTYFKWMDGMHKLGFEAFRSGEQQRLHEKAISMAKMGIDDTRLIKCEIDTSPFTVKLDDIYG